MQEKCGGRVVALKRGYEKTQQRKGSLKQRMDKERNKEKVVVSATANRSIKS